MAVQKLRFAACSASADSIRLILRNRTWRCALLCRQKPSSYRAFDCRCSSLAANILRDFAGVGCASMKYSFFYWKIKWVTSKSRLCCISLYWKKNQFFPYFFLISFFFQYIFALLILDFRKNMNSPWQRSPNAAKLIFNIQPLLATNKWDSYFSHKLHTWHKIFIMFFRFFYRWNYFNLMKIAFCNVIFFKKSTIRCCASDNTKRCVNQYGRFIFAPSTASYFIQTCLFHSKPCTDRHTIVAETQRQRTTKRKIDFIFSSFLV